MGKTFLRFKPILPSSLVSDSRSLLEAFWILSLISLVCPSLPFWDITLLMLPGGALSLPFQFPRIMWILILVLAKK